MSSELTLDSIRDIRLYQREKGYRFSLDALLLYDFVRLPVARRIADLGAGSGVIGLLLAKKYPKAMVVLVELQRGLYGLALKNIALNGLDERVSALKADMRDIRASGLEGGVFDLVVSNPPFRRPAAGRISGEKERALARHEIKMSLGDLMGAAAYLAKNRGRFCMIYHPERLPEVVEKMGLGGFALKRLRYVHGRRDLPAKMMLIEAVKGARQALQVESPLVVYEGEGEYGPEVRRICGLS